MRPFLSCLWMLASTHVLSAQGPASGGAPSLESIRRATVLIKSTNSGDTAVGSGFILSSDGVVATAAHVIRGAASASVHVATGEDFDVQGVIALDEHRDFALLRVAGFSMATVTLGNSDSVAVGRRLLAFGAPLGLDATVSDGLLSATRLDQGTRLFQVSIPVSPGSSGGPVATEDGNVVAIVVAGIRGGGAENLNFALPINYLRGALLLASTKSPTPLGQMTYETPASSALAPSGFSERGLPGVVNDSLDLDWRALAGSQVRTEVKGDKGFRRSILVDYGISTTPTGNAALERHQSDYAWTKRDIWTGRDKASWYRDDVRNVIHLDASGFVGSFYLRTPLNTQFASADFKLQITGNAVAFDSSGSLRSGVVPRGTLPGSLLGDVIAALPDSLPSSVYVWVLDKDTWPATVTTARIAFGERSRVSLPLAQSGSSCNADGKGEKTRAAKVEVVAMTATIGAVNLGWPVLARRPHLPANDVECVRLPGQ